MRCAIITPYYRESRLWLEQCIDSVRSQTIRPDHILVADGLPQDWIDTAGVRHLRLDRAHGDYGNTPRALGALLAVAEQYDSIGFLDADNWLEPNHIATCTATYAAASLDRQIDYVIARRRFCWPDGSVLGPDKLPIDVHVDTSCFFFFPSAYHVLPHFGTMPVEVSGVGDRVFYAMLRQRGLQAAANAAITVNYRNSFRTIYLANGETPPPDAKPDIDGAPIEHWVQTLTAPQRLVYERLCGFRP